MPYRIETIPEELYGRYLVVSNDKWKSDELYYWYQEEVKKFLGDKYKDKLEVDRLIIALTTKKYFDRDKDKRIKEFKEKAPKIVSPDVGKVL